MSNEERFQRIEDKVDNLREDVIEIKVDMKHHIEKVEEHITGDKKIINEIQPLLAKLPGIVEIVEDHAFDKKLKKKRAETIKHYGSRLGLLSLIIGIVTGVIKLLA